MWRHSNLKEGITFKELRLAADCIAEIRKMAVRTKPDRGEANMTIVNVSAVLALAARIEELSDVG